MTQPIEGRPVVVFLAEDNPDHAELVVSCLRELKVINHVVHVSDGEEALNYLFRRGEYSDPEKSLRPDLILLDLRMPKVDGLEVLKQLKTDSALKHIPTVILTTSDAETDVARAYEYHANSYLVKPIQYDDLLRMISDMGYYWLAWNCQSRG